MRVERKGEEDDEVAQQKRHGCEIAGKGHYARRGEAPYQEDAHVREVAGRHRQRERQDGGHHAARAFLQEIDREENQHR